MRFALSIPLDVILTPGQAHDLERADARCCRMAAEVSLPDKAFDADERVIERVGTGKVGHDLAQEQPIKLNTYDATSSSISSASSSNAAPSQPATIKPPGISSSQSTSQLLSSDLN